MAKAGYPNGEGLPPIEMLSQSDSFSRQFTELEQRMFAAIGVKVQVSVGSWPEFSAKIKNRKGQMWSFARTADYPDAGEFSFFSFSTAGTRRRVSNT